MEFKIGAGGKVQLERSQQNWHGSSPEIMQVSLFAGQEMMLIQESDNAPTRYELHYLGFVATGFNGIEDAKRSAPTFARKVLDRMKSMVSD